MAEIDKITLEVEGKASTSTKGIEDLITKLNGLDGAINSSLPNLKQLNSSFKSLSNSSNSLKTLDFSNAETSLKSLGRALNIINVYGKDMQSLGTNMKSISSGINSMKRAINGLNEVAPKMNTTNIGGMTSQLQDISKLSQFSESFNQIKEGAKAFNSGINTMNKASDKFPEMMKKINNLDLTKFKSQVKELASSLGTFTDSISKTSNSVRDFSKVANSLPTSINKATSAVNKAQKSSSSSFGLGGAFGMGGGVNMLSNLYMLNRIGQGFGFVLGKANDFIETMNLFNVVLGENTGKAMEFNKALQGLGVDQEQAMRYQSSFYDIGKSLGMASKNAYTLSEQFTKLAYDYSSLYNMPVEQAFEKLQSGIVGVVRPLRGLGKDISEAKLKETALTLGIEENVRAMAQSDKATLRFITLMRQSGSAMNDMERTIQQPANALRILKAQFTSLARELGALFIPMLTSVLPYLIAFAKFLRGIIADIASLFGVKMFDIDFKGVNSSLGVADDYTNNMSDNLDKGAKSAKKIKDFMLGIDELNVLNPDTGTIDKNTGASGAGGILGGIDLEKFGYEELLQDIQEQSDGILQTLNDWKIPILAFGGLLGGAWLFGKISSLMGLFTKGGKSLGTMASLGKLFSAVMSGPGLIAVGVVTAGLVAGKIAFDKMYEITNDWGLSLAVGAMPLLGPIPLAIYGIYKAFQPVVETTDVLGSKISDVTKKKMGPFIETFQDLNKEITKIEWSGVLKDSDIDSILTKVDSMVQSVLNELDADKNDELKDLDMLKGLKNITNEQYDSMLKSTNKYYDVTKKETEDAQKKINEIMAKYKGENIELTTKDSEELKRLNNIIKDNAVTAMSESEEEQMIILNRLKYNQKALTVQAGSEILVEAKKNYDKQITEAQDWKARMMSNLDKKFYDEKTISKEEYDKQLLTIQTAYTSMTTKAKTTYEDITGRVRTGMGEQYRYIDEGTGKIKSKWEVFTGNLSKNVSNAWGTISKKWNEFWSFDWVGPLFNGISKAISDTGKKIGGWVDRNLIQPVKKAWNSLGDWWGKTDWNPSNWKGFSAGVAGGGGAGVRGRSASIPQPLAFASGGFVPQRANFLSPDSWTAGENGRKELIGSYKGRTTVMPLENTSFVSTMYEAVYDAVRDASQQNEITVVVQPKTVIDSKEIYQSQEEYKFKSGGSLIKKK